MFFRAFLAKGTADSIRKSPGLEAKRKSLPRSRQIPQPARLHECFLAPFGQGAASVARNPPGLEAKRPSPPRVRQIPQPAGLHECFLDPFGPRVPLTQSATRLALRPNESCSRGHAKSRSPQGCMNVFLDLFWLRYRGRSSQLARP